jgi:quercetin dioxygenase-like cupin family protein
MHDVRLGALCWNQYTDWAALLAAGVRAGRLGYDTLWTWDRGYATEAARRVFDDARANPGWPRIASVTASGPSEGPPNPR